MCPYAVVAYLCVCVCVWVFRCLLTSSSTRLAGSDSVSGRCIQQAHVRHLDSGPSLSYKLAGSLSKLSPPLCIPLLHTWIKEIQVLLYVISRDILQRVLQSWKDLFIVATRSFLTFRQQNHLLHDTDVAITFITKFFAIKMDARISLHYGVWKIYTGTYTSF